MRTDAVAERTFEQDSPVHAYWLAHCERFGVRAGRRTGVVERVELDESLRPRSLAVRFAFRRAVVPADEVQAVVPAKRLLVVEPAQRRHAPALDSARTASTRAVDSGRRAAVAAGGALVATAAWLAVALALIVQSVSARSRETAVALSQHAERARAERRARRIQAR